MARSGSSDPLCHQQKVIQPQDDQIQQNTPGFEVGFPSASAEKAEGRKLSWRAVKPHISCRFPGNELSGKREFLKHSAISFRMV